MNEFLLHERLLLLESIAAQYSEGKKHIPEIRKTLSQLSSRHYRVAVIGEFKRGKSSLINAIIGAEVLPTDILPMTATITRVTYGNKRKILIQYKDGHTEEQTVEQLLDYATKYDAQKEKVASSIREIVVYYPSVFCQNHIEILDTPGLNDNESMTEVTLSVLGEIDAAIVVISANHPMSMTEKRLILDLIEQREIRHLVFAVTHIDAVSQSKTEQDRIIQFVRERISNDVLQMAAEKFKSEAFLRNKAKQILQEPDLFGVSSVQAIEGFVQDNWDLLEKSRFPHFKNELLALLTSAQSMDMADKANVLTQFICSNIGAWYNADIDMLQKKQMDIKKKINQLNQYYTQAQSLMNERFMSVDEQLAEHACGSDETVECIRHELRSFFISQLATIREKDYSQQTIQHALDCAFEQSMQYMQQYQSDKGNYIRDLLLNTTTDYGETRLDMGFPGKTFAVELKAWLAKEPPMLEWTASPVPEGQQLKGTDIILCVNDVIEKTIAAYVKALNAYISEWRVILIRTSSTDIANREPLDRLFQELKAVENDIAYAKRSYQNNLSKISSLYPNDSCEEMSV